MEGQNGGRVTICVNIYKDICLVHKPGGASIDPKLLIELC